jgi:hemolysin-activating ACP:hemolysin acyltransferase
LFFAKRKSQSEAAKTGADAPDKKAVEAAPKSPAAEIPAPKAGDVQAAPPTRNSPAAIATPSMPAASVNGIASPKLPATELKKRADYSRGLMQAFGSIVAVYLRSPAHRDMRLSDIEKLVGPAISTGQFLLAEATRVENGLVTPIAAIAWAHVSDAVDRRIASDPSQPLSLTVPEWKCGDIVWIVDAVGDQGTIATMFKNLQSTAWKGKKVRMRAQAPAGGIVIHTLA